MTEQTDLPASGGVDAVARRWRHLKRGSVVVEAAIGRAQAASRPIEDMDEVRIYQHQEDGSWWVRRVEEFDDGRFAEIASLSPAATPVSEAGGEATIAQRLRYTADINANRFDDRHPLVSELREAADLIDRLSDAGAAPVGEIVMFAGVGKEVSWRKGKLPPVGTKLYALAKPASSPASSDVVREALREIAEQDVTEIALDPDWPRRIANAALSQSTSGGRVGE